MNPTNYRLDKSFGKAQSFEEADNNKAYWMKKSARERLEAAWHLTATIYGISPYNPPPIDKTAFSMRKHQY